MRKIGFFLKPLKKMFLKKNELISKNLGFIYVEVFFSIMFNQNTKNEKFKVLFFFFFLLKCLSFFKKKF